MTVRKFKLSRELAPRVATNQNARFINKEAMKETSLVHIKETIRFYTMCFGNYIHVGGGLSGLSNIERLTTANLSKIDELPNYDNGNVDIGFFIFRYDDIYFKVVFNLKSSLLGNGAYEIFDEFYMMLGLDTNFESKSGEIFFNFNNYPSTGNISADTYYQFPSNAVSISDRRDTDSIANYFYENKYGFWFLKDFGALKYASFGSNSGNVNNGNTSGSTTFTYNTNLFYCEYERNSDGSINKDILKIVFEGSAFLSSKFDTLRKNAVLVNTGTARGKANTLRLVKNSEGVYLVDTTTHSNLSSYIYSDFNSYNGSPLIKKIQYCNNAAYPNSPLFNAESIDQTTLSTGENIISMNENEFERKLIAFRYSNATNGVFMKLQDPANYVFALEWSDDDDSL